MVRCAAFCNVVIKGSNAFAECYFRVRVQAFIIGWTSDLVPKILYEFESENNTLTGYVNASLSVFNTTELPEDMRPDKDLFNSTYPYCR